MEDKRNVRDEYKNWTIDLIREDVQKNTFPYAVAMQNFTGDFNFGTLVRNGNAFGAKEIFYIGGKKHWDRRGDVGARHYSSVVYLPSVEELKPLKERYVFVGLENNIERSVSIKNFVWPKNALMIFGEERNGLTPEVMALCDHLVHIDMVGSIRSINVGSASAVALHDYMVKWNSSGGQAIW